MSNENLRQGLNIIGISLKNDINKKIALFNKILNAKMPRIRIFGCCALDNTEVARGNAVTNTSTDIQVHDFAASIVIVREAGGIITDFSGKEPTSETRNIVTANTKENYDVLIKLIKEVYEK